MQIQDFSIWEPLLGGVLIGLASATWMYFNGKIAGIPGIFRDLLVPSLGQSHGELCSLGEWFWQASWWC